MIKTMSESTREVGSNFAVPMWPLIGIAAVQSANYFFQISFLLILLAISGIFYGSVIYQVF
jgi:hypothetical protein